MYTVMLVDDEPEIIQGLKLKVDWEQIGLTITAEALNGRQAIERLEQNPVDIVVTDMNMPLMSGVEFLEQCQARFPEILIMVITGYEDFQYARAAIRSHARDYLLKPVARDELARSLEKVKQELDQKRSERQQQGEQAWRLSRFYEEMKENFILRLLKDPFTPDRQLAERSRLFHLDRWEDKRIRFVTLGLGERGQTLLSSSSSTPSDLSAPQRPADQMRLPFELVCREWGQRTEQAAAVFRDTAYPELMHVLIDDENEVVGREVSLKLDELIGLIEQLVGIRPLLGQGPSVQGMVCWKDGYIGALLDWNLREKQQLHGSLSNMLPASAEPRQPLRDRTQEMNLYLAKEDFEAYDRLLQAELEQAFRISRPYFAKTIFRICIGLEHMAHEHRLESDGHDQLWIRPEQVLELRSMEEAFAFIRKFASKLCRQLQKRSAESSDDASRIRQARLWIDGNYMYDLSLTEIAERFNYHPSYFSELFKTRTGQTFIGYVTEARMKQATHLLGHTGLSLSDIAELTGFSNASYFSAKFKKLHGIAPSEYRQQQSEKNASVLPKK
ncbi:response regulator transcription factor [Saccharibacillus sacchari]|uniref:Response regulator n=1 Tax=Saccharibacillus sacchari TaxID=456493 RepID=A0ACC6P736_9BACL